MLMDKWFHSLSLMYGMSTQELKGVEPTLNNLFKSHEFKDWT